MAKTIHPHTNIVRAMIAIDAGVVNPVVITSDFIILLDTSNKELGDLIYTFFVRETKQVLDSYSVRFGTYHTVGQCILNPFNNRWKYDEPVTDTLPPPIPEEEIFPHIIP